MITDSSAPPPTRTRGATHNAAMRARKAARGGRRIDIFVDGAAGEAFALLQTATGLKNKALIEALLLDAAGRRGLLPPGTTTTTAYPGDETTHV